MLRLPNGFTMAMERFKRPGKGGRQEHLVVRHPNGGIVSRKYMPVDEGVRLQRIVDAHNHWLSAIVFNADLVDRCPTILL